MNIYYIYIKISGNSLVVQWLGLDIFTEVAWVQTLVRELRPRKPSVLLKKICVCMLAALLLSYSLQSHGL